MCVMFFGEDLHPQPKTSNGYINFNESAISNKEAENVDITLCTRWES